MKTDEALVLVVDDDQAVRESIKFSLEIEGLPVAVIETGEDLLAHPHLAAAKCLVLDFKMSAMDGITVLRGVRSLGFEQPAVMITANATANLRQQAAEAGMYAVLEKPLRGTILLDTIRKAMRLL